jgi:hypothetical protein
MDDAEIDRLRRAIWRSFNSSPHKKKCWLALLEMHSAPGGKDMSGRSASRDLHASAVNSDDGGKNCLCKLNESFVESLMIIESRYGADGRARP